MGVFQVRTTLDEHDPRVTQGVRDRLQDIGPIGKSSKQNG